MNTETTTTITRDAAVALLRECAWAPQQESCGHRGCEEHLADGEPLIHSRLGGFGADHTLASAEENVAKASEIRWVPSLLRHNLCVVVDDRAYCYDVPAPAEVQAAWSAAS